MGQMKDNVRLLSKAHSTKVAVVVSALIYYWLQLSPEEQQKLIAAYPWLTHAAPLAALGSWLISRVWPQGLEAPASGTPQIHARGQVDPALVRQLVDEAVRRMPNVNPDPAYPKPPAPPPPPPEAASPRRPLTPEETRTVLEAARLLKERDLT